MKKENVIDFLSYRENQEKREPANQSISDELKTAIQLLIYRLRELGPLPHSS